MKKLITIATAAMALTFVGAGTASAGHCNGGPGAHAQATAGNDGHNEGEHQGWSTCVEQAEEGKANSNRGGNR